MSICKSQLSVIHIAKAKLKMTDDDYRDLLWGVAGVESSKELDSSGFEAVMDRFLELGFKSTYRKRQYGERPGMATPKQVKYIRQLWLKYTGDYNETSLNHWIEKSFGISNLRFVDTAMVSKVITGLKAMTHRKHHITH